MQKSTFKQRLNSTLKDNAIERYISGKKKGRLDFNKVHKIVLSNKIFKQKEERKGKDYSITLLLDRSGSMDSQEKQVANIAQDFTKIFMSLNIPTSVYAFHDNVFKLKSFGEKQNDVMQAYLRICSQGTDDAYALHVVGNEITKAKKKNILIVLTDGQGTDYTRPAYADYYNTPERQLTREGVNLIALKNAKSVAKGLIKINSDLEILCLAVGGESLKKYAGEVYGAKKVICVTNVNEARQGIIKLINKVIKKA